ncbi:MAG: S8 family peptidase [Eubacteriales bacterium]|nr:S8 family peptidase [Eubacteriales bacterium]
MNSQKAENELNLALDATEREREKSLGLGTGYDPKERTWELIVKYSGSMEAASRAAIQVTELSNEYAVLVVKESMLEEIAALPQIEYIEKPRRLFFMRAEGMRASCMTPVSRPPLNLTGRGVLVAVLDSGADYRHPEFLAEDGSSRILALWDQTARAGSPPEGFHLGAEYTKEQLDRSLREGGPALSTDATGHGTGVLAVAAGNGGVAPQSRILAVKLGFPRENGFPRTTELMMGLDYAVRKALEYQMPLAVNVSFGNTYGSHRGTSLLETYMDDMSNRWKTVICVGSGNEGARAGHTAGRLQAGTAREVEFSVGAYEPALSLQIWKDYADEFDVLLISPAGTVSGPFSARPPVQRYAAGRTELLVYYGEPGPYSVSQEIFVELIPAGDYIDAGVWTVRLEPRRIVRGGYEMWLPSGAVTGTATRFLEPVESNTLTIPSTASRVVTVGAYDASTGAYADFSGRGSQEGFPFKPDLAAPGVRIRTAAPGGGYEERTGTSFAVPFVTGTAALLMQYGIVEGNAPYLYGEKVKAWLRRGASPLPAFREYPNPSVGYGALCAADSLRGAP